MTRSQWELPAALGPGVPANLRAPSLPARLMGLPELRRHWGDVYEIEDGKEGPRARRREEGAPWITSTHGLEGLRVRIRADYAQNPLPRDVAP